MGRQPQRLAFGPGQPGTGQSEELRQPTAQPRQIAPSADIGKNADRRLGHGEQGPLGRDAVAARAGNADTPAHRHAVHEDHSRLGVSVHEVVQAIFVEEKGARRRLMAVDIIGDSDDIAARAEAAPFDVVDQHDADIGIVTPVEQSTRHRADHRLVEAVQRLGPIEADSSGEPFGMRQ